MKRVKKRPIKVRRRWVINPKTRVQEKTSLYDRQKEKKAIERYGQEEFKT